MSSKRRIRRCKCGTKTRYSCIAAANSAAWKARVRTQDHIRAYKCCFGNHWHIGHASAQKSSSTAETIRAIKCSEKVEGGKAEGGKAEC